MSLTDLLVKAFQVVTEQVLASMRYDTVRLAACELPVRRQLVARKSKLLRDHVEGEYFCVNQRRLTDARITATA